MRLQTRLSVWAPVSTPSLWTSHFPKIKSLTTVATSLCQLCRQQWQPYGVWNCPDYGINTSKHNAKISSNINSKFVIVKTQHSSCRSSSFSLSLSRSSSSSSSSSSSNKSSSSDKETHWAEADVINHNGRTIGRLISLKIGIIIAVNIILAVQKR